MPKQLKEIREIEKYIKSWLLEIDFSTALCYTDINKVSEGVCRNLLNLIFGYELEDLGKEQVNFPAVDLGDDNVSKIGFQVTSDTTRDKIIQSLKKFKNHGLDKRFIGGIKFLILNGERKRMSSIKGYEDIFDTKRDILYMPDLIKEISSIYWDDQEKFIRIKDFLKSEFADTYKKEPSLIFPDQLDKIENYVQVVKKSNLAETSKLAHFVVNKGEELFSTEILFEEVPQNNATVLLGASGCGKSAAAKAWTISLCEKGMVPLILVAKYFENGLAALIEKEILPYGFPSAISFISACAAGPKKILLVIDGLNECSAESSELLISEVRELSGRYEIPYIITTQQLTKSLTAIEPMVIKVSKPNLEQKKAVAAKYSGSVNKLEPILKMVSTSMEARMVGEIGEFGVDNISRYSLFELFVRKKLKDQEIEGIHFLSSVASKMSQAISFSLSIRQADAVVRNEKISNNIMQVCINAGILEKDFAHISFSHEMLMDFFIADSVTRFSEDSRAVVEEFNAPKNDEKRLLILGAIEDNTLKEEILDGISDTDLLVLMMEGEAGEFCRFWAAEKLKEVLSKMRKEIHNIEFVFEAGNHPEVLIKKGSIPEWRNDELAFVEIIIYQVFSGELLEEVFSIVHEMDSRLELVFTKMRDEAIQKNISLRSGLFQALYSPFQGKSVVVSGLSHFFSCLGSGFMSIKKENKISVEAITQFSRRSNVKTGQLYLLLLLSRYNERAHALFGIILHCLSNQWQYLPRILKFEIVDAVPFCHNNEEEKESLIEAINLVKSKATVTDPMLSSNLFEALAALGAFDSNNENYEQTVLCDMREILADQESEDSWRQASYFFNAQFDHPYSSAFSNVIESLNEAERKAFYTMALKYDEEFDLFLSLLILSAEKLMGEQCCRELVKILDKPILEATMSQERMKNHIVVCLIMAKHKYDLTSVIDSRKDEGDKFLVALAEVFYWINRRDLDNKVIMEKCAPAAKLLFESYSAYLIDSLKFFNDGLRQVYIREYFNVDTITVESVFTDHILSACRHCLKSRDVLSITKFKHDSVLIYRYAVDQIGLYGNSHDLAALKAIVDDASLGRAAVGAVKQIEKRCSE